MVKIAVFSSQNYVKEYIGPILKDAFPETTLLEARCDDHTAALASGYNVVCLFVNDDCNGKIVETFANGGVKFIAMRCAGFDRVDLKACAKHGIKVARVPAYSPSSIAEMAVALLLALNRKIHLAYTRVREGNYTLSGLTGFEMRGKKAAVLGTGAIGYYTVCILQGFGCKVLPYDPYPNAKVTAMGIEYVSLDEALSEADVIALHVPLLKDTFHMINAERISKMKKGALLVNVSRGGLVDSEALLEGLKSGHLGGVGMDVYEHEDNLFFTDYTQASTEERMKYWDNTFALLKSFPNVIIAPHSAFFTEEALTNIATTTVENIHNLIAGVETRNEVKG